MLLAVFHTSLVMMFWFGTYRSIAGKLIILQVLHRVFIKRFLLIYFNIHHVKIVSMKFIDIYVTYILLSFYILKDEYFSSKLFEFSILYIIGYI
jgi:hypothetical protein